MAETTKGAKRKHLHIQHSGDEERITITLDGKSFASANHDDDGWAGMERVEETARKAAKAAGWRITEDWGDDDVE